MELILGVDPGAKGGVCALAHPHFNTELSVATYEFIELSKNPKEIFDWFRELKNGHTIRGVWIEEVHSLYGMSAKSNFSFGYNVALPNYIAEILELPTVKVPPKTWQKVVGVIGSRKDLKNQVADLAKVHYPHAPLYTPRGRLLDGFSDALMIAHYGYLKLK